MVSCDSTETLGVSENANDSSIRCERSGRTCGKCLTLLLFGFAREGSKDLE